MLLRNKNSCYIGIDPGIKGAISLVDATGSLKLCLPFPSVKEESRTGRKISRPDISGLISCFHKMVAFFTNERLHLAVVMIEKQVAMPGQNAVGTFNTGKGYGILLALIEVFWPNVKVDYVGCKEWQERMIINRTPVISKLRRDKRKQLKADSVSSAQSLFPEVDFKKTGRSKVDSDGMTDSALISAYCYHKYGKS